MKILIADDDESLRDIYKQVFDIEKIDVDIVKDGEQAFALLQKGGYDLILLDIHMPKIDGMKAVEMLSRIKPISPNGPVYFLTNDGDAMTMAKGVTLGVRGYLVKTQYTPDGLIKEIKRILEEEKHKTS